MKNVLYNALAYTTNQELFARTLEHLGVHEAKIYKSFWLGQGLDSIGLYFSTAHIRYRIDYRSRMNYILMPPDFVTTTLNRILKETRAQE